jgi:drug/metabolite transporter (DMT)-like permease
VELWIPITLAAAFLQNLRSALQKHLKGRLSTSGATYVRFLFAAPLAALYVGGLGYFGGYPLPDPGGTFFVYALVGAAGQVFATALLVHIFAYRNFAVGTAFSKTETVQTAIIGAVILLEPVGPGALAAILISLIGVLALSVAGGGTGWRAILLGWTQRTAILGILSGSCFGVAAVSYRAASLSLGGEGFLMQAAFTLAFVTVIQTLAMSLYMRLREPGQVTLALRSWRVAAWVGLTGMLASAGWFTAMTIQNAAYVRALGQVELVFTFAAAHFVFRERANATEIMGILLVVGGILLLLMS